MEAILQVDRLNKFYGSFQALKNLSLKVEKGSVYGLLGPNGSGKTTTLSIILSVIPASSGTYVWSAGGRTNERKSVGALVETPNFYDYLSGEKNLKIAAEIKSAPVADLERVLRFVGLYDRRKDKFRTYSLGMKQRLAIASALLGDPEVLVLDEPTNGLDPQGIAEIRDLINRVSAQGCTIIIASHLLDEVEKVCTDVAIIKNGVLMVQGKVGDILQEGKRAKVSADDLEMLSRALEQNVNLSNIKRVGEFLELSMADDFTATELNQFLFDKGITASHLSIQKKNLEMQFLEITRNT